MRYGKTLKIFVMGKEPRSLKSVELVNWTGLAYLGRREHLAQARKRDELNEPAVYLLLSDGAEDSGAIDIYVGETDNFAERLNSHAQTKPWWSQFIVFVSKDKNLTKAHVNNGLLQTTRDIEFRSPSSAGAIVRGGQTNGRTDWKRVGDDKPLFECESESTEAA
jgi:hypothetical protein